MSSPTITIVLCTYNRAEMLRDAAGSLLDLATPFEYEVLIVDNNSSDHTPQAAAELAAVSPRVRYVRESQQGIVYARNRGVLEAQGEWIAFFDDDQRADPNWLAELLAAAQTQKMRCAGGAVLLQLPSGCDRSLAPMVRLLLGETVGLTEDRRYSPRFTPGCGNLLLHRSVFDEVGLFDPAYNGRGEDTELFMRMFDARIAGWCTPRAIVHHLIPEDRLTDAFLLRLAETMSVGMASDERREWGPGLYPAIWLARLGQCLLQLAPRWMVARLLNNHERLIGARCRMRIARNMLRDGLALMLHGEPTSSSAPPLAAPTES